MKEINLKEILHKVMYESDKPTIDARQIYTAMRIACKQTLELAAENGKSYRYVGMYGETEPTFIDKQSILDLINQIK